MQELQKTAQELRAWIIEMLTEAKSGHPGGSLSVIDLITALWMKEMKGVEHPDKLAPNRDRFVLSKGHGVPALYAVLAKKGFIKKEELKTLRRLDSRLQGHPDRVRLPIVEASTGSLGQGMSVALGMALAARMDYPKQTPRVFCIVGDGEIQEGQIWEAALAAPKFNLSNLIVILDANNGQIDGRVSDVMPLEPLSDKWKSFGWSVTEIDGHDFTQITQALEKTRSDAPGKPHFIVARTVKGKGVSFMENKIEWHGVAPKADEAIRALEEIRRG